VLKVIGRCFALKVVKFEIETGSIKAALEEWVMRHNLANP
jgi:hypothetical protein